MVPSHGTVFDPFISANNGLAEKLEGKAMKRALITIAALGIAMSSFGVCLAGMF